MFYGDFLKFFPPYYIPPYYIDFFNTIWTYIEYDIFKKIFCLIWNDLSGSSVSFHYDTVFLTNLKVWIFGLLLPSSLVDASSVTFSYYYFVLLYFLQCELICFFDNISTQLFIQNVFKNRSFKIKLISRIFLSPVIRAQI